MPELPEVQTTVDRLADRISGRRIVGAWMDPKKPIRIGPGTWPTVRRSLIGRRITSIRRRAKYIVIGLETEMKVWVHQKMTGHLLLGAWRVRNGRPLSLVRGPLRDDPMNRYIRLVLTLDDKIQIGLSDARRFARIIVTKSEYDIVRTPELSRLGPEPLELSESALAVLLGNKRGMIKPALMEPSFIAGIGNIYADEILHRAGVHPFRPANQLNRKDVHRIHHAMRSILTSAVQAGGSSTDDYRTPEGIRGGYQNRHRAYHRTGQHCTLCRTGTIVRTVRNGRSTHFCPNHQV